MAKPDVNEPSGWWTDWKSIDWSHVRRRVRRLQVRIAEAVREGNWGKVRALQRTLTRSLPGRLLAVRRVTTNKGNRTPGIDGVLWNSARKKVNAVRLLRARGYRPQPLRRAYIPKKSGKRRPLGIPTMRDRAMQALHKLALDPVAETLADPNSYGFRHRRSIADAHGQLYILLAKSYSPELIYEGDIESCFDKINHEWILDHVPMDRSILRKWLKSGYLEDHVLYPTEEGTPQGGLISPVIANMTLDGLEGIVRAVAPRRTRDNPIRPKVHTVRYADDFVITSGTKEALDEKVGPAVVSFLERRGLSVSAEKTRVTNIYDGFDFLGANIRKRRNGKILMKPAPDSVRRFLKETKDYIRRGPTMKTEYLIRQLNRRIRGWANQFRHLVASKTFRYVDSEIFKALWRWARRRHGNKGARWVYKRYFFTRPNGSWAFFAKLPSKDGKPKHVELTRASYIGTRRHVKVRAAATVFDPRYDEYYEQRRLRQRNARHKSYHRWRRRQTGALEAA